MAKNVNAISIMKDLLSSLFKYANPILNTVSGFKATGSRLCMWLWTLWSNDYGAMDTMELWSMLSNDSAYSSLFVNHTSRHSHAHVTSVCFWQPM